MNNSMFVTNVRRMIEICSLTLQNYFSFNLLGRGANGKQSTQKKKLNKQPTKPSKKRSETKTNKNKFIEVKDVNNTPNDSSKDNSRPSHRRNTKKVVQKRRHQYLV